MCVFADCTAKLVRACRNCVADLQRSPMRHRRPTKGLGNNEWVSDRQLRKHVNDSVGLAYWCNSSSNRTVYKSTERNGRFDIHIGVADLSLHINARCK